MKVLSCLLLVVPQLTVPGSSSPASQSRSEDAWLAVINSAGPGADQQARQDQDTEQYQFEQPGSGLQQPIDRISQQPIERVSQAQQPVDRVPQAINEREPQKPVERLSQQPIVQQQFQPQLPQRPQRPVPQQQQIREPLRPGQFQRKPQRPIQRQRPGPGRRPLPGPKNNRGKKPGGIIGQLTGAVDGIVKGAACTATNIITDEKMKDEDFILFQLNCARGRGPCDEIGNKIKILAPEVLANRCPPPCDKCTQKQIRRVMSEVSQRFPTEFQEMMRNLRG